MVDGRPAWSDLGAGRARVSGYGGSLVTHVITPPRPRRRLPRLPLAVLRAGPRCEAFMPKTGTTCARMTGHSDSHRSLEAVLRDSARRRATR